MPDLRIVVAQPLAAENAELLARLEPRLDVVFEPELLGPVGVNSGGHGARFERTAEQQARFEELLDSADALFGIPSPAALSRTVDANPRLRWVHTIPAGGGQAVRAAGLAPADLERIRFTTSAGVYSDALAEFAAFGVLAGAKQLGWMLERQRAHEWGAPRILGSVAGSTALVVGLGSIGRATATKLAALGVRVVGVHRREVTADGVESVVPVERFAEATATADAIVLCLPGTDATRGMLSAEVLAAVKPGVTIVNVGRGTTVDEPALVEALRDGRVGAAVLDVTATEPLPAESPLWDLPGVLISPHTAAAAPDDMRRVTELVAENARRLLDGEPLRNVVDTVEFY
jgi:Phosphoglycerate dehydrogenase and related dehydrogenases